MIIKLLLACPSWTLETLRTNAFVMSPDKSANKRLKKQRIGVEVFAKKCCENQR
ncbi:hypothetical protein [Emticicia sp. SJ17W-69]|uniref:hypothetical protein n=1 Tax=Emticicia sp. SJ17W-69 TaxID=3421657 RepID=UPI003EBA5DA4